MEEILLYLTRFFFWKIIFSREERQASDQEIRGSNPGPGSTFSLENLIFNILLWEIKKRVRPNEATDTIDWTN